MSSKFRSIAIPQDHGSWIFLFSPLLIGLFAAPEFHFSQLIICIAGLVGFLLRQPVSLWVKIRSGRRADNNQPLIIRIIFIYGLIILACVVLLVLFNRAFVLLLAIPGGLTFLWHLYLVSLRKERHQMGVDIIAGGTLALAAPAIFWSGIGEPGWEGMLLWLLCWLQTASSIVHIFMRLEQRDWKVIPALSDRFKAGWRNLLYSGTNLIFVIVLGLFKITPILLLLPYFLQFLESVYGIIKPATGMKPTALGIRQLVISSLFTILFILFWTLP